MSFRRGTSALVGAIIFPLVWASTVGSAQTPPASPAPPVSPSEPAPAAKPAAATVPDARQLAASLRQSYTRMNSVPTRLTETFQTVTRALGQDDVSTSGTLVTYQLGPNARTNLTSSTLVRPAEVGATEARVSAVASAFEWLRTPDGIQFRFQPAQGGGEMAQQPFTMIVKAGDLDPQMRALTLDPLATLRTFDLMADAGATVRREYARGVPILVFATRDPIEMAPGVRADLAFWIDPSSTLVTRMLTTFQASSSDAPGSAAPSFIDYVSDFSYSSDVLIPNGFFALSPLPPQGPQPMQGAPLPQGLPPQNGASAAPPTRAIDAVADLNRNRDFLLKQYQR